MNKTKPSLIVDDFDQAEDYAQDYLRTYFMGEPTVDDQVLMSFLAQRYRVLTDKPTLLEVGCGPVINHVLPAAPYVSEIHMADFRNDSVEEIRKWKDQDQGAHTWNTFTKHTLRLEGIIHPSDQDIKKREDALRKQITTLSLCDLRSTCPLGNEATYPAVACFYTTEQAASTLEEWRRIMKNLASLVAPGGHLFTCAMGECDHYILYAKNGAAKRYPVPKLGVKDYEEVLGRLGFDVASMIVKLQPLVGQEAEGVLAVILIHAQKFPDAQVSP